MADQNEVERLGRRGRRLKDLRKRVKDRRDGEVIIDGRRLVSDLVRWGVPIRELYLVPEISGEFEAVGWRQSADEVFEVEASVLTDIAPTRSPQGVLAIAEEPRWLEWPAEGGVALWLDRIQDPGNVGAIVRSAAGLGAEAVLLSPECADPFGASAVRGSAGAVFRIPVGRDVGLAGVMVRVRESGGEIWATDSLGQKIDNLAAIEALSPPARCRGCRTRSRDRRSRRRDRRYPHVSRRRKPQRRGRHRHPASTPAALKN